MRVHFVKKAQRDNPVAKKGEGYYWWKHAFRPKQYSKTHPTRAQLAGSAFLAGLYALQDNLPDAMDRDDVDALSAEVESLCEECRDSLENMPESLRESSESGQLLQARIDALEEWIDALESVDTSTLDEEQGEDETTEDYEERMADARGDIAAEVEATVPDID